MLRLLLILASALCALPAAEAVRGKIPPYLAIESVATKDAKNPLRYVVTLRLGTALDLDAIVLLVRPRSDCSLVAMPDLPLDSSGGQRLEVGRLASGATTTRTVVVDILKDPAFLLIEASHKDPQGNPAGFTKSIRVGSPEQLAKDEEAARKANAEAEAARLRRTEPLLKLGPATTPPPEAPVTPPPAAPPAGS